MRLINYALFALILVFSMQACALSLDAAKSQGLVGEQPNGYLGIVQATPEVVQLVSEVNKKRRRAYERIAEQNGITVEQVELLAGRKAIKKTKAGYYIKTPSGEWVKK